MQSATFFAANEAATADLAQRLARALARQAQDSGQPLDAVIELHGDLGAGKTTLVRHLLRALGVAGRIKSPTYALVEPYELPAHPNAAAPWQAFHLDLYRFSDPREWADAGLRDVFATPALKLVEWPERAAGAAPVADVQIWLRLAESDSAPRAPVGADDDAPTDTPRQITLQALTPRGVAHLQAAGFASK